MKEVTQLDENKLLKKAKAGDIRAFHTLYADFQPQLKSYLYRLMANRNDMEDMAHDVFIIAFEHIKSFRGESSLKTWVFTIATNHAKRHLKNRKRWIVDTMDQTRQLAYAEPHILERINQAHQQAPQGVYEIKEHIDYCFTCVTKMLPLLQQIALILKDIYGFKTREISGIIDATEAQVKHYVRNARQTMIGIFDKTCALVHKNGVCNQCSELNGKFNPKQDKQAKLMEIKWVNRADHTTAELLRLRTKLVKGMDPLLGVGADLHEAFLWANQKVNDTAVSAKLTIGD